MIKSVPLSKIKDSPWRNKKRNPIDQTRVDAIEESIDTTEFWSGVYGREMEDGTVQIAFGHHRVEAAKQAGLKEITVEIQPFTNGEMLIRMSRENLRGDLLGTLEVVEAAVKAFDSGDIELENVSKDTRKDALRFAPSFVPGKEPDRTARSRPYTADTIARFLGGVYRQKPLKGRTEWRAQDSVHAALALLEMEERKVKGFSEKVLQVNGAGPDGKYVGARQILKVVSAIKQGEIKAQERATKTAEEVRVEEAKQRKLQADIKEREEKESKDRKELLDKQLKARLAENEAEVKRLQQAIKDKAIAAEVKAEADKVKLLALEVNLETKKKAAQEQSKADEYLPVRKEADRIIHILERRDLEEDLKALSRRPLNLKDRQRVWEAIDNLSGWLSSWAAAQFSGPVPNRMLKLQRRKH